MPPNYLPQTSVSVIIAVRNEEKQIKFLLHDLESQKFPAHLTEIIIIDDHSDDKTLEIISAYQKKGILNLRVVLMAGSDVGVGKKAAVARGIAVATGDLLVFTDGDCRVQPEWLLCMEYVFTTRQTKFISGPVMYEHPANLFERLQAVEFAGLIGIGGSSIAMGKPNMCNGANMAYPKNIFSEVAGFSGNDHIPSGDDEFIMHKVHQLYPGEIYFLKNRLATVHTRAKPDLPGFLAQRIRWASKWPAYQRLEIKLLAGLIFIINFFLLVYLLAASLGYAGFKSLVYAVGAKVLIDILFLWPVLKFFRRTEYLWLVLPLQLVYIPYVVLTAFAGLRGTYTWKGRHIMVSKRKV